MFSLHVRVRIEMMWIIFEVKNCFSNDHTYVAMVITKFWLGQALANQMKLVHQH